MQDRPVNPYTPAAHTSRSPPARWGRGGAVVAGLFFVIHAIAVLVFAWTHPPFAGPDADAGAMSWLMWLWVDFPIGFAAVLLAEEMPTNAMAVICFVVVGGFQWAFIGWIVGTMFATPRIAR